MATIYDVAERAGVSAKTVSRVVNEDKAVKASTRERVLEAMDQLGYRRNMQARQLRMGPGVASIGILLEDPAGGYQGRFHHALLMACMEAGKFLTVELYLPGQSLNEVERFLANSEVRSLVLLPPLCDYGPLKTFLKARGIHCVLISPTTPDSHYPSIAMDDRLAARNVTDYLLALGHTRIAHIAGHPDHAAALLRRQGYQEAFDAVGLPRPPKAYVAEGMFNFRSGITAAETLLNLPERPTAIFASNDEMAAATCAVAHKMGLNIPQDLAVVGFDDAPISSAVWPAMTTVRQPYVEMARLALQLFGDGNGAVTSSDVQMRHVLPHEIIERETTTRVRAAVATTRERDGFG
ncbi:LacI family DNA-binding transcriptional regulator [Asticcacaulis sp. AC402]|uniref:LacI family DNA-binding transcriptional regulator n=1 Tax=Asticcacaulis sp. AC402 TaxID=1282361 RepID=UPI0003C3BEE5|nr:LacI family DNA-binding transcriptional regulator [Asticcacaulis sp. AC402]ESQ73605.1 hypothetical protein ABAC402_18450 [Asticcacaulis sp. AC402]